MNCNYLVGSYVNFGMYMYQTAPSEDNEQRVKAVMFTTGIAVAVVLLLMFVTLYRPDPLPSEKIIELQLGVPDAGGGGGGSSSSVTAVANQPKVEESGASENIKESPVVNVKPNNSTKPNTNTNTKPDNTKPINNNALFPGMNGDGDGQGDGKGGGKGDGSGNGSGGGNGNGNGKGDGNGTKPGTMGPGDYVLEGRLLVTKPVISESFTEEGKVFVNVWVDQNGNVTRTSINESKTNTSSSRLRALAEKAAKKIKWDVKPNAPVDQKGYYIFNFVLK